MFPGVAFSDSNQFFLEAFATVLFVDARATEEAHIVYDGEVRETQGGGILFEDPSGDRVEGGIEIFTGKTDLLDPANFLARERHLNGLHVYRDIVRNYAGIL